MGVGGAYRTWHVLRGKGRGVCVGEKRRGAGEMEYFIYQVRMRERQCFQTIKAFLVP